MGGEGPAASAARTSPALAKCLSLAAAGAARGDHRPGGPGQLRSPAGLGGGIKVLKDWGFRVQCGPEVFPDPGLGRQTDRLLARRFEEIWLDPEVKAVMAVRGGYGSLKLLPHLDLAPLGAAPKRLVGFSDLTNLLWDLHRRLGLVTFHGPTVAQLPDLTAGARQSLFHWLTAPGPRTVAFEDLTVLHPGVAEGPLAGGNLTTLCHLVGTPFAPQLRGLSAVPGRSQRGPTTAWTACSITCCWPECWTGSRGWSWGPSPTAAPPRGLLEVFTAALAPLEAPVLAGLPVGHQPDNHTLPLGAWAASTPGPPP